MRESFNDEYFEKYLNGLMEILKIDSTQTEEINNMPFGEGIAKTLDATLAQADALGFATKNGDNYYGYSDIGEGEMFGILGHLDTVPFGNGWEKNPLGEVCDNILYGRGVLDNKGPILATLYATAQLIEEGYILKNKIRIIFGCNEESGWKCMDMYTKKEEMPKIGFSPDGDFPVINCEKGMVYYDIKMKLPKIVKSIVGGERKNMVMDRVMITLNPEEAEKHNLALNAQFSGKSAHASTPNKGDNAFWKLLEYYKEYDDRLMWLYDIVTNDDGSGYGIKYYDDASGALTINIGTISSSETHLQFSIDIRYPITMKKATIAKNLSELFGEANITETGGHNSLFVEKNHPLIRTLLNSYERVTGKKGYSISIGGGTYARALETAVAFGPILPNMNSTIHQKDENVSLKSLKDIYQIYHEAIKNLCFEKNKS